MRLQDIIAALAGVTAAHGEALLAKGDEPGACEMFAVQEAADDLLKRLTASEATEALVEDLMHARSCHCEVLTALTQAINQAPHWRANARRIVEARTPISQPVWAA